MSSPSNPTHRRSTPTPKINGAAPSAKLRLCHHFSPVRGSSKAPAESTVEREEGANHDKAKKEAPVILVLGR
jgi:hypothetical protein